MSKKLFWVSALSASMALVEAAVVVYMRELYYPGGFSFPFLPSIPPRLIFFE